MRNFILIFGVIIYLIISFCIQYEENSRYRNNYNYSKNNLDKILQKNNNKPVSSDITFKIGRITKPTFMDEKCQMKYPGTKYNKNTDKCECVFDKDFDENLNSCPNGSKYENIIGTNLEFDYCDESGFILPVNAHCTPFDGTKRWECDSGYYQSKGEGEFSGQTVCVNRSTYEYRGLITCERDYYFEKDEEGNELRRYRCKPNSERALKNNYEKVDIY